MIAKLHIEVAPRNGISFLKHSYFTPPFKIADITEHKKENFLHLMLMSSSPGILDGDQYEIKIEVGEYCKIQLHTQSYQRLFTMKTGATQITDLHLKKGATFYYLPLPAVPHENSNFTAVNKIYLSENCHLVWGEVLTCGRKLNGEIFKFSKYHTITEVYLRQKLVIKENLLMQPAIIDVNAMGQLEGFTHQASLIIIAENLQIADAEKQLTDWLSTQEGIMYGLSACQVNGLVVRLLGNKAEQLYDCLKTMTEILAQPNKKNPSLCPL